MERTSTYDAVAACALALLSGATLQVGDVTAGYGRIIDWRTVKSGEELQADADAFDTAQLFVTLVGPEAALSTVADAAEPTPLVAPTPNVAAFMVSANGGRRRSFDVGGFTVYVEPEEDDAAQEAFTKKLAQLARSL